MALSFKVYSPLFEFLSSTTNTVKALLLSFLVALPTCSGRHYPLTLRAFDTEACTIDQKRGNGHGLAVGQCYNFHQKLWRAAKATWNQGKAFEDVKDTFDITGCYLHVYDGRDCSDYPSFSKHLQVQLDMNDRCLFASQPWNLTSAKVTCPVRPVRADKRGEPDYSLAPGKMDITFAGYLGPNCPSTATKPKEMTLRQGHCNEQQRFNSFKLNLTDPSENAWAKCSGWDCRLTAFEGPQCNGPRTDVKINYAFGPGCYVLPHTGPGTPVWRSSKWSCNPPAGPPLVASDEELLGE
jgi:hypothetical protein